MLALAVMVVVWWWCGTLSCCVLDSLSFLKTEVLFRAENLIHTDENYLHTDKMDTSGNFSRKMDTSGNYPLFFQWWEIFIFI